MKQILPLLILFSAFASGMEELETREMIRRQSRWDREESWYRKIISPEYQEEVRSWLKKEGLEDTPITREMKEWVDRNKIEYTANARLWYMSEYGTPSDIQSALDQGADINCIINSPSSAPLHRAIYGQKLKNVKYLLEKGAHVNKVGFFGPPLHRSVDFAKNDHAITKLLLEHGAEVNAKTYELTALDSNWATPEQARLLLDWGGKCTKPENMERAKKKALQVDMRNTCAGLLIDSLVRQKTGKKNKLVVDTIKAYVFSPNDPPAEK